MRQSSQNAVQLNLRCVINTFHAVGYFASTALGHGQDFRSVSNL